MDSDSPSFYSRNCLLIGCDGLGRPQRTCWAGLRIALGDTGTIYSVKIEARDQVIRYDEAEFDRLFTSHQLQPNFGPGIRPQDGSIYQFIDRGTVAKFRPAKSLNTPWNSK